MFTIRRFHNVVHLLLDHNIMETCKFVLLKFFAESPPSVEIAETAWLEDDIGDDNCDHWVGAEVICNWRSRKSTSSSNSSTTASVQNVRIQRCAAHVLCYSGKLS